MNRSLLFVVLAVTAACTEAKSPPAAPPVMPPPASSASVRWVAATSPKGTALLEAPAHVIVSPAGKAVITAPLRARIVAVHAQPGAAVARNAALVEVVLPEAAAAASAYLAAVDEIAAHDKRASQLEALQKEGLGKQADVAAVQLELARLRGVRDTAAATLRAAGLEVGGARGLVSSGGRTTLRAPIAGVVTAVAAVVGASHPPEEALVEIAGGGATRVEARLPRSLPPTAKVEFVAIGAAPIAATFVSSAPSREPDGATRAWFELATPAPAGASGRLRGTLPDTAAVLVPVTALSREATGAIVWKRHGDRPAKVAVQVLATSGADALVEGIAVGDQVAAVAAEVDTEAGGAP